MNFNEVESIVKKLLAGLEQCKPNQHMLFKRMYAKGSMDLSYEDTVRNMDIDKLTWALQQVERTVKNNILKSTKVFRE